jgi:hypothetical protein
MPVRDFGSDARGSDADHDAFAGRFFVIFSFIFDMFCLPFNVK